jgi:hypothetical protein
MPYTKKSTETNLPKSEAVFVKISGHVFELNATGWTVHKDDGEHG